MDNVTFVLGSLIYPKHMLKVYEPDIIVVASGDFGPDNNQDESKRIILRKQIKRQWS